MTVSATLQAELDTIDGVAYVGAHTVVAIPPSDLDPRLVVDGTTYDATTSYTDSTLYTVTYLYDQMRVDVDGWLITRDYDPEMS